MHNTVQEINSRINEAEGQISDCKRRKQKTPNQNNKN